MQHDLNLYQPLELRTEKGLFRFYFHHFYSSNQVERFRLTSKKGEKQIIIEKKLFNVRQPWKIIGGELRTKNAFDAALTLLIITKKIDLYLDEYHTSRKGKNPDQLTAGHVIYFNHDGRA